MSETRTRQPLTGRVAARAASEFEQRLGHTFADPALLRQALTHRSFSAEHNERLEFLGDAVLDCVLSPLLMARLPAASEGDLHRARADLVCQTALHARALELGLSPLLHMGAGLERDGGREQASLLADAFEAVIGAVHQDAGYEAARGVVERLFAAQLASPALGTQQKDAKTTLQELLQRHRLPPPEYALVSAVGATPQPQVFTVMCRIAAHELAGMGSGPSRRAAEQAAAGVTLGELRDRTGWA
ncbi:MAG: ribonuclease III [Rhodocyclaceae bacterium]|nr:ribonuclease III [Rhodocyclaceae bacterium]